MFRWVCFWVLFGEILKIQKTQKTSKKKQKIISKKTKNIQIRWNQPKTQDLIIFSLFFEFFDYFYFFLIIFCFFFKVCCVFWILRISPNKTQKQTQRNTQGGISQTQDLIFFVFFDFFIFFDYFLFFFEFSI